MTREFAGERLARVVCGDREMLDEAGDRRASPVRSPRRRSSWSPRGVRRVRAAASRARRRAVVTGLGDFIAAEAARRVGLEVVRARGRLGPGGSHGTGGGGGVAAGATSWSGKRMSGRARLIVVKVGGGLSADRRRARRGRRRAGRRPAGGIASWSCRRRPVRRRRARVRARSSGSPPTRRTGWRSSRWISTPTCWPSASRAPRSSRSPARSPRRSARPGVAVLAPYRWMRAADVLPHTWDATSDSVAAFVAGALDAERLVLVKPDGRRAAAPSSPMRASNRCGRRGCPAVVVGWERVEEALGRG